MTTENMRVTVVGDETFTLGFEMAGVSGSYNLEADEFAGRIDEIMENEEGVLIVEGALMDALPKKKRLTIQNSVDPVVVPLTEEGSDEDLRSKIKQAIGIDIWD